MNLNYPNLRKRTGSGLDRSNSRNGSRNDSGTRSPLRTKSKEKIRHKQIIKDIELKKNELAELDFARDKMRNKLGEPAMSKMQESYMRKNES